MMMMMMMMIRENNIYDLKPQFAGGNRLAFFDHDRGVDHELATVEKHFQLVVKAVFKPRASGLPD